MKLGTNNPYSQTYALVLGKKQNPQQVRKFNLAPTTCGILWRKEQNTKGRRDHAAYLRQVFNANILYNLRHASPCSSSRPSLRSSVPFSTRHPRCDYAPWLQ